MYQYINRSDTKFAVSYRKISSHNSSSLESRCPAWISSASLFSFLWKQQNVKTLSSMQFTMQIHCFFQAFKSDVCVPVGLLCFFDQLLKFINPVSRQPLYYHILHCLHHFTFLATFTPEVTKALLVWDFALWHIQLMHVSNNIKL